MGKSDHVVLVWKFVLKDKCNGKQPQHQHFNFRKAKYPEMIEDINRQDWKMMPNMSVEEAWSL